MTVQTPPLRSTNFHKVCRIGTIPDHRNRRISVFLEIGFKDGKLSIAGVEGPTLGGNAIGSSGQIDGHYKHRNSADDDPRSSEYAIGVEKIKFAPGWDADLWLDVLDIWKQWHLNDMQAGCEHQKGEEWKPKEVEIVTYSVDWAAHNKLKDDARNQVVAEGSWQRRQFFEDRKSLASYVKFSPAAAILLLLNDFDIRPFHFSSVDVEKFESAIRKMKSFVDFEPFRPHLEMKREKKLTNWLRENEHPQGYLCKPCSVCGYEYGTAWLKQEVPEDVLQKLWSLPDADIKLALVWGTR